MSYFIKDSCILIATLTFSLLRCHMSCSLWKASLYFLCKMRMKKTNDVCVVLGKQL